MGNLRRTGERGRKKNTGKSTGEKNGTEKSGNMTRGEGEENTTIRL
jgi:hypothetical protein